MSNIDKQALRTAAENATPGEWCIDDYHGVIADAGLNANYYIASCSGPDNRSNKRFIAAANPATVLALLDELEAKDRRIADLESREVTLPRPECTYADHSYPAYSERQVVALLESLGIRINRED